ncbi:MAG: hypothetical protein JST39_24075 [Bacteroidetes bacterium]|nr:hypothetical protein [Bacteroidota bacterium]
MDGYELNEERKLLKALARKDVKAFAKLYNDYKDDLVIFAFCRLQDIHAATLIVDKVFERLWFEAKFYQVTPPIYRYLRLEVQKSCLL